MEQAPEKTWRCPACDRAHRAVALEPGESARCRRCGTGLQVHPRSGPATGLAWSVTGLALFLAAGLTPLLEVRKAGLRGEAGLLVADAGLADRGMPLLGAVAGALAVWLPVLALILLTAANLAALCGGRLPGAEALVRALRFCRQWAMPEVFVLAALVAFLKVDALAETRPGTGLWLLAGGSIALLAAFQRIDRDGLPRRLTGEPRPRPPGSFPAALALMLAAMIMLVPANLLPIMEVHTPSGMQRRTILGGVASLAEHRLWGIAAIVFAASIMVPFAKLGGLGWLLLNVRQGRGGRRSLQLHRTIGFIGRWSMLDVFLLALLAGLIQFGALADIRPGPAAPAFAAAVILTVLAVDQFDPRHLWRMPASFR